MSPLFGGDALTFDSLKPWDVCHEMPGQSSAMFVATGQFAAKKNGDYKQDPGMFMVKEPAARKRLKNSPKLHKYIYIERYLWEMSL